MKKIFAIALATLALSVSSCEMDFYSSDSMTPNQLKENPSSAIYTTDGIYALFKEKLAYKGQSGGESGNYYVRHYFQLSELRGDNVTVSGMSEDPFTYAYTYKDIPTQKNIYYTWWIAYKIINVANTNISAIIPTEGNDQLSDHLLGENYFFRAIAHFHMVTLFAQPYVCGRDNPGVVLRVGTDASETKRSTVGEIYDQVVKDLKAAIKYMDGYEAANGGNRGNKGYVSADAARALLSRVYLYMENWSDCLTVCNELMAHAPSSVTTGYDYADYPTHTYNHEETIWCVAHDTSDEIAQPDHAEASIASMYLHDVKGWGEHYWSEILIDLFQRYDVDGVHADKRFASYFIMPGDKKDGKVMVTLPYKDEPTNDFCSTYVASGLTKNADGSVDFKFSGKTYKAVPSADPDRRGEYYVTGYDFVQQKAVDGYQSRVFVRPNCDTGKEGIRNNGGKYVIYYNTKFSYQDGNPMLTSPVFLRWGEVVLNRAEARYHTSDVAGALEDVNIIRRRAGLPATAMFSETDMHGYTDALDVILDERRMELCFEGHRMFDVYRNRKSLDRRYVGYHPYEVIPYTDLRIALLLPEDEINTTGMTQIR
jgi:hypothetical protein